MLKFFKSAEMGDASNKLFFVGLGNPGSEYAKTRHNVGYMALDVMIDYWQAVEKGSKKGAYQSYEAFVDGRKIYFIKPLTYMNLSGKAVQAICTLYKCQPTDFIVIYDDIALPFAKIRIRKQGSAGGHNGIKSIIEAIGQKFPRIKIGIGDERDGKDLSGHVLSKFSKEESQELQKVLNSIPKIAESILEKGIDKAISEAGA